MHKRTEYNFFNSVALNWGQVNLLKVDCSIILATCAVVTAEKLQILYLLQGHNPTKPLKLEIS